MKLRINQIAATTTMSTSSAPLATGTYFSARCLPSTSGPRLLDDPLGDQAELRDVEATHQIQHVDHLLVLDGGVRIAAPNSAPINGRTVELGMVKEQNVVQQLSDYRFARISS